jgi:hypothetical protein
MPATTTTQTTLSPTKITTTTTKITTTTTKVAIILKPLKKNKLMHPNQSATVNCQQTAILTT